MMTDKKNSRHGVLASLAGFGITFILLYLLSLSHQFLTRRSESQTRISLGPAGGQTEALATESEEDLLASLQSELQNLQQDQSVSELSVQDIIYSPRQVDWTAGQPLDFASASELSATSLEGMVEGIVPPMESTPNALFIPGAEFPERLIREGVVSGVALLHIRIGLSGHCQVLRVMQISNPGLKEAIVKAVEEGIFQVPREDGQIKEREVLLPINFRANEERVRMIQANLGTP